jgi:proline iminopeptidase
MIRSFLTLIAYGVCFLIGCRENKVKSGNENEYLKRENGSVISKGITIDYFIQGVGLPIIVVTEGELISKTISNELKKHFKFIFVNARVNLANPGEIGNISFRLFAEDIDLIRRSLNLKKVGIFGHSISGIIALEYSREYPENTNFVIINGTPPYLNDRSAQIVKSFWEKNASEVRKKSFTQNWKGISRDSLDRIGSSETGKLIYKLNGPQCWYDYSFDPIYLLKDTYWNMNVWNHIFKNLMSNYDLKQVKPIKTPVFISLGMQDYLVPYTLWDDQKDKIPNLSINLFERSGHYSFFEEEELFRNRINDWIEKLGIKK